MTLPVRNATHLFDIALHRIEARGFIIDTNYSVQPSSGQSYGQIRTAKHIFEGGLGHILCEQMEKGGKKIFIELFLRPDCRDQVLELHVKKVMLTIIIDTVTEGRRKWGLSLQWICFLTTTDLLVKLFLVIIYWIC